MKYENIKTIKSIETKWKLLSEPLREAKFTYDLGLQDLILKHVSSLDDYAKDFDTAWENTRDIYRTFKASEFMDKTDVLEQMLREHIDNLENLESHQESMPTAQQP